MTQDAGTQNASRIDSIEIVGGALCIDFVNTVEGREGSERHDFITSIDDLSRWSRRIEALDDPEVKTLQGMHVDDLMDLLAFRELLYRAFTAIARGAEPGPSDLEELRGTYADAVGHARLLSRNAPNVWDWVWERSSGTTNLDVLRWRLAHSAIELLRSGRLDRLKQCPGGGETPCNWLFIDTTKGRNRRWCSMSDCGGRAKWRRQNARRRKGGM